MRYNPDGGITIITSAAGAKLWEAAFKQEFYKRQNSQITVMNEIGILRTVTEARHLLNTHMKEHWSGYKIQGYCMQGVDMYIRIRPMSFLEGDRSKKYQRLFAHTNNLDVLKDDPMWQLELTEDEFRKELQSLKHT